jgi:hypothetical protein
LQIQVLTEKLELQRDTIHEYEQLQRRTIPKYRHPTANATNFYHSHIHQPPSFMHHVCTTVYISLDGLIAVVVVVVVMLFRSVTE